MKNKINEMSGRRTADRKLTGVLLQWVQLRIPRKEAGSGGSSDVGGSWRKGNGRGLECPLTMTCPTCHRQLWVLDRVSEH